MLGIKESILVNNLLLYQKGDENKDSQYLKPIKLYSDIKKDVK
jgi:hypothetical protein